MFLFKHQWDLSLSDLDLFFCVLSTSAHVKLFLLSSVPLSE